MAESLRNLKNHPIDKSSHDCHKKAISSEEHAKCINDSHEAWEELMNAILLDMLSNDEPNLRKALEDSQQAWSKFRIKEFEYIDEIFSHCITGNFLIDAAQRKMEFTRYRVMQLTFYRDLIFDRNFLNQEMK
jgi:uncharacterized protein YecT (DUF1311 family)